MKVRKIDIGDIEGFRLGNAEYSEAGTGCTVIICEEGAVAGVDVRGGAPATRETDLLRSENTVQTVNAVVLSGGSAFGLEAASGVMRALAQKGIGFSVGDGIVVPIVPGASLYDLAVGRSDVFPDAFLGMQAVECAYSGTFLPGNHGAGTGATCGKMLGMDRSMKTGLGTFACGDDVVQVGAIAAVNACADVYNGAGNIIAGLRTRDGSKIQGTIKILKEMLHSQSEKELDLNEIKYMAAEETKTRESADPDDRSDIAKAIMEAYEQASEPEAPAEEPAALVSDIAESAEPEPAVPEPVVEEPAIPEIAADEPTVFEPAVEEPAVSEPVEEESAVFEEPVPEPEPEPEITEIQETVEEPVAEEVSADMFASEDAIFAEPETAPEQPVFEPAPEPIQEPVYVDPYELSEEEERDKGYDIPFNTTIACLITNAKLTKSQANKLASILHDAYARAIKPVHSTMDGDTIFVMSTNKEEVNFDAFAALATDVMQYAIIDGAMSAEGAFGLPAARDLR